MAILDTLTTRDAIRRATLDDIIGRCQAAADAVEGGALDGVDVVSMGVLRDQVTASLMVKLPPPSERHAEVSTPANITVSAVCPECKLPVTILVVLTPTLTVDNGGAEISVKAKSKAQPHVHGQLPLPSEADGQLAMDDVVIDDLRLRILRAIADIFDEGEDKDPDGVDWPTLDALAIRLELESESDRGDLEESLYSYSQLADPLVEVRSAKGEPVRYVLTTAGEELVDAAADDEDEDADGDEPNAEPVLL